MIKTIVFILVLIALSTVVVGQPAATNERSEYKAYVNIGQNTLVLPEFIKFGDKIIISNLDGDNVFETTVPKGVFYINTNNIRSGLYVLSVIRNKEMIVSINVPLTE